MNLIKTAKKPIISVLQTFYITQHAEYCEYYAHVLQHFTRALCMAMVVRRSSQEKMAAVKYILFGLS